MPYCSRGALALATAVALAASACGDVSAPQPLHPGDIREHLLPEVAAQLTPQGTFPELAPEPNPYPQITADEAREIAVAWARTFGKFHTRFLEEGHGKRIDFDALEPVSPAWYAAAVYEPLPAGLHAGHRNAYGPYYLLYLGRGGEPVISVAVAAHSQARVVDGELRLPREGGNEIIPEGVRVGTGFSMPVSPEQAVRIAAGAAERRVSAPPTLLTPPWDYHPQHSRWKVTLERPVTVRSASAPRGREVREIYVGLRGEITVPAPAQQDVVDTFPVIDGEVLVLHRRSDRAVDFERVTRLRE